MSQWRYSREFLALGASVRELRSRRRLTQEGLGFAASVHRNYVGSVERGEINPTFYTLLRLMEGLDVSLTDLAVVFEAQRGWEPVSPQPATLARVVAFPQR
ncbi:MAG TPA: helix-turn-helix transcriptional regulator [Conexibacter sp.]|nr:helix-turn-helix transcriptional regulator [Conexibacter sp.]